MKVATTPYHQQQQNFGKCKRSFGDSFGNHSTPQPFVVQQPQQPFEQPFVVQQPQQPFVVQQKKVKSKPSQSAHHSIDSIDMNYLDAQIAKVEKNVYESMAILEELRQLRENINNGVNDQWCPYLC